MRKYYVLAAIMMIGSSAVFAAPYKGQKIYIESCKGCHGGGQEMAASKKQREWSKIMDNKGEKLAEIHLNSKKAEGSWTFFNDRSYAKSSKHLEDFLVEYAKDSGNVPACN
ncbi:MAG: cytochrome C [Sulfuricurvum sp.]